MGSGAWSHDKWDSYTRATAATPTDKLYSTRAADIAAGKDYLLPITKDGVARMRESRDSADNPASTPIIVGIDVTGSMGMLADTLVRKGLGTLFGEILNRKPVTDPHVMFMGIGDANCDRYPLQVSQFEADARIIEQLTDIYLEKGGGGNAFESYNLPWYFAAHHTSHDSIEKRNKKGYLFTAGDEEAPHALTVSQIKSFIGDDLELDASPEECLQAAQRMYHVFHLVVEEGNHARFALHSVLDSWHKLLGQNVLRLSDHTKMSEVIVSAIQVTEGAAADKVIGSWSEETALVVRKAISDVTVAGSAASAVARF